MLPALQGTKGWPSTDLKENHLCAAEPRGREVQTSWIKSRIGYLKGCKLLLGVGGLRRGHHNKKYFWRGLGR